MIQFMIFEEENNVQLPDEIRALNKRIEDNYDYEVFYLKKNGSDFILLREILLNDSELVDIVFDGFEKSKKLREIIQHKINQNIADQKAFYAFAYNPLNDDAMGCLFVDREYKGIYQISVKSGSEEKYIGDQIDGVLFNNIEYDHEFRFYQTFSEVLINQDKIDVPACIGDKESAIYLYEKKEEIDLAFYTDVLSPSSYMITDGERIDDLSDYATLFEEINDLIKDDFTISIDGEHSSTDSNILRLSLDKIKKHIGENRSDYINYSVMSLINSEAKRLNLSSKKLVVFWDIRFGQEIGIAYLGDDKKEKLISIGTAKLY